MGLFNQAASMPITKEIEIEFNGDGEQLVAALAQARIKAKLKGTGINISSGLFGNVKYSGTIMEANPGEWTGAIMIIGPSKLVLTKYSQLSVALKRFIKK